jgi:hypothetical protein
MYIKSVERAVPDLLPGVKDLEVLIMSEHGLGRGETAHGKSVSFPALPKQRKL